MSVVSKQQLLIPEKLNNPGNVSTLIPTFSRQREKGSRLTGFSRSLPDKQRGGVIGRDAVCLGNLVQARRRDRIADLVLVDAAADQQ